MKVKGTRGGEDKNLTELILNASWKMTGVLMAREVLHKDGQIGLRARRCACHPCMRDDYATCTALSYTLGEPKWSKYAFV